ncbi:MAG TPA: antitoxin [Leucothrix sp.]|nr:antitoxin [Leucothrix sp.]
MQTKLTLRLESELIEQAKIHAKEQGKSLSQVVADYFRVFTQNQKNQKIAPVTSSLIGVIKSDSMGIDDYKQHLEDKYL